MVVKLLYYLVYKCSQQEEWKCRAYKFFTQVSASPFHLLSHVLFVFSEVMPLRVRDWLFSCLYSLQGRRALTAASALGQYDNICQGRFSGGRVLSHRTSIQCPHPVWVNPFTPDTAHPSPLGIQPLKLGCGWKPLHVSSEQRKLSWAVERERIPGLSCCSLLTCLQDSQICDQLT